MSNLLTELNEQQQEVVKATEGPVLVLAGAGSGKTRALTYRIAYLLTTKKAQPSQILAVTFTNKAAGEMKERVHKLMGGKLTTLPAISTFHSLGVRMLREHSQQTDRSPKFIICDAGDSEKLIKMAMKELNISRQMFSVNGIKNKISMAKNSRLTPSQLAEQKSPVSEAAAAVFARYEQLLRKNDAFDFDDLIIRPIGILETHEQIRQQYQNRWRYLLVDEYQDTNPPQDRILELLIGPERNICVVGDDYQAIYSWRGANVEHILQFEKKYPDCQVVYLTRNYRSSPAILSAANGVIAENVQQKHKRLWTDKKEGEPIRVVTLDNSQTEAKWIRQEVEQYVEDGGHRKDCVILYRTNAQSRAFEEEFLRSGMPYTIIGGFRFYERREIKDALAFLQFWVNRNSLLAVQRIAATMWRGVGPKTLARWSAASGTEQSLEQIVESAAGRWPAVQEFVSSFRSADNQVFATVADLLKWLLGKSGYLTMVKGLPDSEERMENLEELLNVATAFSDPGQFLEEVALLADIDTLEQEHDRVTCMTLHGAKGLEYPVVYVVGCEEGLLPHANSVDKRAELEEERRLLYVGMTRAMKSLTLTWARTRYQHGQVLPQTVSRFLSAIEKEATWLEVGSSMNNTSTDSIKDYLARSSSNEPNVTEVEEGYFIRHDKFGRGVVIEVSGSLVTCIFEQCGVKTLDAAAIKNEEFSLDVA